MWIPEVSNFQAEEMVKCNMLAVFRERQKCGECAEEEGAGPCTEGFHGSEPEQWGGAVEVSAEERVM